MYGVRGISLLPPEERGELKNVPAEEADVEETPERRLPIDRERARPGTNISHSLLFFLLWQREDKERQRSQKE